jgi:hypothetical protein
VLKTTTLIPLVRRGLSPPPGARRKFEQRIQAKPTRKPQWFVEAGWLLPRPRRGEGWGEGWLRDLGEPGYSSARL